MVVVVVVVSGRAEKESYYSTTVERPCEREEEWLGKDVGQGAVVFQLDQGAVFKGLDGLRMVSTTNASR